MLKAPLPTSGLPAQARAVARALQKPHLRAVGRLLSGGEHAEKIIKQPHPLLFRLAK